jgi:predicted TPR repeat methyltransferase
MPDADELDERLGRVYANPGDKRALYDDWAATYDRDLVGDLGYVAHLEACRRLQALVADRDARILDAGCGTGLVGRILQGAGYRNLHGSDYSPKMLQKARASGAYRSLTQHDLTRPIVTDEPYDAAIVVGVFAFSEPSAEHLVNVTACLKPHAIALVTVNGKAWHDAGWAARLDGFDRSNGAARLLGIETIDYLTAEGIDGRLLTLQRSG